MTRVHDRQVSKTSRDVHAKESDALWIRMMETLSDGEKIRLDGTIQAFYKNVYLLLLTYSSNTGAIYYAKHKAAADSILPPGIREMPLCIFGHGMLLYRFLSVLKQGNLASVLKRICRAMQRIIDQYR
jgi:hypothetical protein